MGPDQIEVPFNRQVFMPPPEAVVTPKVPVALAGQVAPPVAVPAPAAAADPPGMVEALKQRFAADIAERDLRHRAELEALRQSVAADAAGREQQLHAQLQSVQQSHAADVAAREEQHAAQVRGFQQAIDDVRAQLTAAGAAYDQAAQAASVAQTELQTRHAQLAAQHLELDSRHGEIAQLRAEVAELTQALAAERQVSTHWNEQAQRLTAKVRDVVAQSHDAALQAAGRVADAHEEAVKRGDHLEEQVALHGAAVNQLRTTIEQQRADRNQLMEERQAARTRCVELEAQLHALTADARHLAEGLQRVQAEREAERRQREEPEPEVAPPPRLRLAGASETA